jgi:hypothetical protein
MLIAKRKLSLPPSFFEPGLERREIGAAFVIWTSQWRYVYAFFWIKIGEESILGLGVL